MTPTADRKARLPLSDPAVLLATWFGIGYLPVAPGTWASLAALPLAWGITAWAGWPGLAIAAVLATAIGIWCSGVYAARSGTEDPGPVVIDEVAGQWLVLLAVPLDPLLYGIAFVTFRLFDIVKPWPVSWADRSVGGGLSIMLDDIFAGAYGLAVMVVVTYGMGGAR